MSLYRIYGLLTLIASLIYGRTKALDLDLNDLKYYEIVEPRPVGLDGVVRSKRDLSTNNDKENKHMDEMEFTFSGHGRNFQLYIYKNTFLIPDSFAIIYQDNTHGPHQFNHTADHCYYHGYLRDRTISSAVVSTCDGLNGVIKDDDGEEFVIQPHPNDDNVNINRSPKYILYNTRDVISDQQLTCGVNETDRKRQDNFRYKPSTEESNILYDYEASKMKSSLIAQTQREHHRSRRANVDTKYIELIAIVDNAEYTWYLESRGSPALGLAATQVRALKILNYVDSYYKTINTRVVIANLIIWNVNNIVPVTNSPGRTLDGIEAYTRDVLKGKMKLKFDHAHLIIYKNWHADAGYAGVGTMCTPTSVAISRDIGQDYRTADTVAHEIGHSIGFMHYECSCPHGPCVMAGNTPFTACKGFATCTVEKYTKLLKRGSLSCLFNYPVKFYLDPVCGNQFLEAGEECDCGNEAECRASNTWKCCNFDTCKLKAFADCAQGLCCHDCKFKQQGIVCRERMNHDCDLEEYCTGNSSKCPDNFYLQNGGACDNDASYCYHGGCPTIDTGCEMLWGPTAKKATDVCFTLNSRMHDSYASCGKNSDRMYIKCAPQDQLCGKLQCMAKSGMRLPRLPIRGRYRGRRNVLLWSGTRRIRCNQGRTYLPGDTQDPTMAASGVKCADNSICMKQKCVNLSSFAIKKCDKPCLNGGVCNNNGHCHCLQGYACPHCAFAGSGGSIDSGAKCIYSDPHKCTDNVSVHCHAKAICQTTPGGGYTCTCMSGYTGDGRTVCTDIDECTDDPDSCDAKATCKNTVGSYRCACISGYTGDGRVCTDIDECTDDSNNCHVGAICTNTPGSYTCACKPGYTGNGTVCISIMRSFGYSLGIGIMPYTAPKFKCSFASGDGTGGAEISIDNLRGDDCIKECIDRKKNTKSINGVTVRSNNDPGCWCEQNMDNKESSNTYKTCFLVLIATYPEATHGTCTGVSKEQCRVIATQRGVKFARLTGNNMDRPAGCYQTKSSGRIYYNVERSSKQCSNGRVCFCQKAIRCNGQDNGCCTENTPCDIGQGDCDNDQQCTGSLVCGANNCPWVDNDDCCRKR